MKKVSINLLTNVILLLAGVILMIFHNVPDILLWGCRVMGAMFMLPAVVYLIMVAVRHTDARTGVDYMGVLPAVGGLCFGLVMILKPDKFLSLMVPALRESVSTVVLITGICLLLFNFTSLQEYLAERRGRSAVTQPAETMLVPEDDSIDLAEASSEEPSL